MAQFKDNDTTLSVAFLRTAHAIQNETVTLRELLELVGEQGLLLFCCILSLPFLLPVSLPGVSTVFGLVIVLIGIGVTLNRVPWLPHRLMNHAIQREHIVTALNKGARTFMPLERWLRFRLASLTTGQWMNRINGLILTLSGILLLFPMGPIPFSNTLPALAIILLVLGMLQRDGVFIIAGYVTFLITDIYFAGLALVVLLGGQLILG